MLDCQLLLKIQSVFRSSLLREQSQKVAFLLDMLTYLGVTRLLSFQHSNPMLPLPQGAQDHPLALWDLASYPTRAQPCSDHLQTHPIQGILHANASFLVFAFLQ